MATMGLDPSGLVGRVTARSRPDVSAPQLMGRPIVIPELPWPEPGRVPIDELNRQWADLHRGLTAAQPSGWLRRVRSVVARLSGRTEQDERALIGSLIRSTNALVARNDQLVFHIQDLYNLLGEVLTVASEDLVQIRASIPGSPAGSAPGLAGPDTPPE